MHTDWSQFFGRFHPLFVHLPIGFVLLAALLQIVAAYKKNSVSATAVNIALLAAAVSASFASLTGYFLSSAGGYDPGTLSLHKWIGFTVTILILLLWFLRIYQKADKQFIRITIGNWLLIVCIVLITIGGHLGGSMTHGEGYLTRYMPGFLQPVFGSKKKPEQKKALPVLDSVNMFTDIIQPIFNDHCVSCHNAQKGKGELNLSNIETILKGGKSGNTIVAGNTEKSELFHRITLPKGSSKFMPSDNRPPLTPVEINFIREWIENGAEYKKNITAAGTDEKHKYLIAAWLGIDPDISKEIHLPDVKAADSNVLKQLRELKVIIRPLTSKSNLLEASLVMVQKLPSDSITSILQKLSSVKQQLYRLDVSNCKLSAGAIQNIGQFTGLNKLEIQNSGLTDGSVTSLGVLTNLTILNAGQNPLTNKSVAVFKKLEHLKKLNLWQTVITEEGLKELHLPDVVVEF